jgi:hypothetical protein
MSTNPEASDRGAKDLSREPLVMPIPKRLSLGFLLEQWAPIAVGLAFGLLGWHFGYLHLLSVSWAAAFLDRVLTMSAILIGYLVAVVAIIPAFNETHIIQQLKSWGYYRVLVTYFGSAIWSSFLLMALSVLPLVMPFAVKVNWTVDGVFSALWWLVFGFTSTAVFRATRLLLKLLTAR